MECWLDEAARWGKDDGGKKCDWHTFFCNWNMQQY